MRLKAIILDDEPMARVYLNTLLKARNVEVVAECSSVEEALSECETLGPDVVFVDIQLSGERGFELIKRFEARTPKTQFIIVSGFSEYAVEAFELDAGDYLLKPVDPIRLDDTLARVRRNARQIARDQRARALHNRLPIRDNKTIRLIPFDKILFAIAQDKATTIRTSTERLRTSHTLTQLEDLLPQSHFLRIHSSCIVNTALISEILQVGGHTYAVRLTTNDELPLSRNQYKELKHRFGVE